MGLRCTANLFEQKEMKMTDEEFRKLDAWIAEHGFGICVKYDRDGEPYNADGIIGDQIISWVHPYSRHPMAFTLIQREIERRGWDWGIGYHKSRPRAKRYDFLIYMDDEQLGHEYAETEELAGCLAFKAAIVSPICLNRENKTGL